MARSGRPETPIDWNLVDKFIQSGCTPNEISGHFRLSRERFYERFKLHHNVDYTTYSMNLAGSGQALLRLSQYNKALNNDSKGNTQMLIWLGKVMLGQREPEVEKSRPPNDDQLDLFLNKVKDPDNAIEVDKDK